MPRPATLVTAIAASDAMSTFAIVPSKMPLDVTFVAAGWLPMYGIYASYDCSKIETITSALDDALLVTLIMSVASNTTF